MYQKQFLNYQSLSINEAPLTEEGNMLVICYDEWTSAMQPFVNWKNTIGRNTTMVSVTEAGGSAQNIKNYVTNFYNTNGLTYLLLVGDATQVPTNLSPDLGGHSDNAYAYLLGDDHYQEFIVGRFSAENLQHVNTQVNRTIEYEMGNNMNQNWLKTILSVASQEGPGDDNELDFEHSRNIQTDLVGFTYDAPAFELFEGSQGGFDAPGFPVPAQAATALNSGVGIVNYTGHGYEFGWATSEFSNDDIANLNNKNKLPFIFSVACVNGDFVGKTCFAEAWLRAEKDGEPTGAVAIIASTINQSWSPPMIGQDEMNDIIVGTSTIGSRKTFGGIAVNGFFKMNLESSDFAMTDTWTCFGDPSLLIRTDNPTAMTVNHPSSVVPSATTFPVNCNFEGALATISFNGQIIGTATVINGVAQIPVTGLLPGQILTIAIIGFNKITYLSEITVISPTGAYLVVNSYTNTIDYGSTANMNLNLKNLGVNDATNAKATVTSVNSALIVNNTDFTFGNINAGSISATSGDAHTITVSNNVPDQTTFQVNVTMTDSANQTTVETKNILVNAPEFSILTLSVDDATGDNNGRLDPNETANLVIQSKNVGHADVDNVLSTLLENSPYLTINSATTSPTDLDENETKNFIFNVTADASTPAGTLVSLQNTIAGGVSGQYGNTKNFEIVIGFIPSYCDAFGLETSDEFIQNVQVGSINNTSQQGPSYSDFTNLSTVVMKGQTYPITIVNGEHWEGDQMGCWVDWNYDGDFLDANETIAIVYNDNFNGTGTGLGEITVPMNAVSGNLRLRVRLQYQGNTQSCGETSYGEVEDYTLNVQSILSNDNFEKLIGIYPNPTNGRFTISTNEIDFENARFEVYNAIGQKIVSQPLTSNRSLIQIEGAEGLYFVKVYANDLVAVKKLTLKN